MRRDAEAAGEDPSPAEQGEPTRTSTPEAAPAGATATPTVETAPANRRRRPSEQAATLLRGVARFWHRVVELWTSMVDALYEEESRPASAGRSSTAPRGRTERHDALAPIRVPAQDGVFSFTVDALITWSSDRLTRDALNSYVRYLQPQVTVRLTHLAAMAAGGCAPHRAAELEAALQGLLVTEGPWRYPHDDGPVECVAQVRVRPDERVRQLAMPYWEQLIRIDSEFDVRKRRAERAEQLSRQVVTILENLAASLTAGPQTEGKLTSEVERLLAEQKATLRRLEDQFREALRDSDLFGRATSDIPIQRPYGKPTEAAPPNGPTATSGPPTGGEDRI